MSPGQEDPAMAMIEQAPRQVAVKVSPEGDRLITSGAHYLHMSKKDLVEAAVALYLDARREEMQAGMRELLSTLDGSRGARIGRACLWRAQQPWGGLGRSVTRQGPRGRCQRSCAARCASRSPRGSCLQVAGTGP